MKIVYFTYIIVQFVCNPPHLHLVQRYLVKFNQIQKQAASMAGPCIQIHLHRGYSMICLHICGKPTSI